MTESFQGPGKEAKRCAKYSGFRIILTSMEFFHNLSMCDAVSELCDLSELSQTTDTAVPEALSHLSGQD